jgi:hypothetical protein
MTRLVLPSLNYDLTDPEDVAKFYAPRLFCLRVVATHQRFLCHSLAFPRTSSGVRPRVQRPVWARSVL